MSRRQWPNAATQRFSSPGILWGVFGFITTNIGTNPDPTLFFGCGGLTGGDDVSDGSAANSGPSFVASIVKTANNGEFLVTFTDGFRKLWHADATLYTTAAGPNDGKTAGVCAPVNEGSGHETPVTMLVTTLDASNVPVETASRRVSVLVAFKDSAVGA